ncbi:protein phosphatase Slingshot isoform X2 [Chelonus insularis]|uniref:protein phosphatase Slingshot isoform X2 n=1 Tax=Chelonus insularis TaxID=460826 RepID=UPI00158E2EBF|nr:protein phosphatase Slingshot isoform X2 [Chelonus insularis]
MALVTVQRSPSVSSSPQSSDSGAGAPADEEDSNRGCKSLSECYFAGKGAALVLPPNERARPSRRVSAAGCDIQQHLQSMFYLLRPEETLKMAVKLESVHPGRTRYLVVVSCNGRQDAEESCLLGIDCHAKATVGLVLRVLADTAITLDGDGGFSVSVCGRQHIFKPVSVQAMWSALQTLHKVSSKARDQNYFLGGLSHDWVSYYEQRIESDRSCLNEWHAMDNLESRRPPSPDSVRTKPREREETERVIRATLKEIMMSVDLDEVTSKYIRGRLEEDLDMDLGEFKPFIDEEMLTILGQMDSPTEIFDHVYLGSEWNASNLEELQKNGVKHILNVTREIDNFFPGMFNYLNVRVYDDEKTDLLKHWDDTFKYITKAKKEGSKVLVHCKMGVSRSASVVIAYAMKAYNWDFSQAWKHVKEKRNCIKPNNNFLLQLETYQGILDAMKNKEKLQRSKSDTNLKSPTTSKLGRTKENNEEDKIDTRNGTTNEVSGVELKKSGKRPKSWSPRIEIVENVFPAPLSQSLESIDKTSNTEITREDLLRGTNIKTAVDQETRNVLMPCDNGQSYSVSQNQIVHLPGPDTPGRKQKSKAESFQGHRRRGLVLNLTNQFEAAGSKPSSPESEADGVKPLSPGNERVMENGLYSNSQRSSIDNKQDNDGKRPIKNTNSDCLVWTASTEAKCTNSNNIRSSVSVTSDLISSDLPPPAVTTTTTTAGVNFRAVRRPKKDGDPFSAQLDKFFDREERREPSRESPSRQSSWSSYDSAVVLDNNSVHSSWATLPSRNSSWGSYDMRPNDLLGSSGLFPYDKEEIPWHPGTVKRTKQKLEEGTGVSMTKRVCTQSNETEEKSQTLPSSDESSEPPFNSVLLQCSTSPTPQRRDSSPTVTEENHHKTDRSGDSSGGIDISPTSLTRQIGRLSTSAPVPSVLSTDADNLPSSLLRTCRSESETSSPCVVNTTQCPSVKHHKMVLENLSNKPSFTKRCLSVDDSLPEPPCSSASSSSSEGPRNMAGIVKNLKKEFEAKSSKFEKSPDNTSDLMNNDNQWSKRDSKIIRSLPSSPVIAHSETKIRSSTSISTCRDNSLVKAHSDEDHEARNRQDSSEDLSVKVLVGKYEVAKPDAKKISEIQLRSHKDRDNTIEAHPPAKSKIAPQEFARRSAPIIINSSVFMSEGAEAPGRPPVPSPSAVVASVVAKAASKKQQQQHGRTHPLARLQVRPRHSNCPVYNTM